MARRVKVLVSLATLVAAQLSLASPASASDGPQFFVDSAGAGGDPIIGDGVCDDGSGDCTLRAAIEEAQSSTDPATIVIPPGTYPLNEPKGIDNNISFLGSGQATTTIEYTGPNDIPFQLDGNDGATVRFRGLTLDGTMRVGGAIAYGGGADVVALDDVRVTRFDLPGELNTAIFVTNPAGAANSTLTIERSTFDGMDGAVTTDGGEITIRNSTFTKLGLALDLKRVKATIESSTFHDLDFNAVLVGDSTTLSIVNTTISDVGAFPFPPLGGSGSPQAAVLGIGVGSTTMIKSSTIVNNGDEGVVMEEITATGTIQNSIVRNGGDDCANVTSTGFTIDSDGSCTNSAPGDQPSTDPLLGPLADNDGFTLTHLPGAGSPAIDTGGAQPDACPATDQRGFARPVDGDTSGTAVCDIGSVEVAGMPDAPPAGTSKFVPLPPARVFDTRPGQPAPGPKGFVAADASIDVQVTGVAGIPASDVSAVVLNVTATQAANAGFISVWPTGSQRPLASTHNLTVTGQTRPNLVTVPVGTDGKVSFFAKSGAHLLADVAGYYTEIDLGGTGNGAIGAADGRFVALPPTRVFDTRPGQSAPGPKGFVAADTSIDTQMTGVAGIPNSGVAAVVINLTGTQAAAAGFVTAWPTGSQRPLASNINLNAPGDTAPNLAIVPLGTGGKVSFFAKSGAHLLADVLGYFTDDTATTDTAGLFVPLTPARLFDTRQGQPAAGPKGFVGSEASITVAVAGVGGVPDSGAAAAVLNLTATNAGGAGFVTGWPTAQARPLASNINLAGPGDTRPNAAFLLLGTGGEISLFAKSGAHLLGDVAGYYLS